MAKLPVIVCRSQTPEGDKDYITCLPREHVFEKGLASQAVVGVLHRLLNEGEPITRDNFSSNRTFVEFMHEVIARRGPQLLGLQAEAERTGEGMVFVTDMRTPTPRGPVPPEDIIGIFTIKGGKIVSYHASPKHVILSERGFFQLDANLLNFVLEELTKLSA